MGPLSAHALGLLEVPLQPGRRQVDVVGEKVHLAALELHVQLEAHHELDSQGSRLLEHPAVLPAVGAQRVVVGDRQALDPVGTRVTQERGRIQDPVTHARVQVKVG